MPLELLNNSHDLSRVGLYIDAWNSEDVPELARLAVINNQGMWKPTPGANGVVVRDFPECIRGFCLLRETPLGFVVDELWHDKTRRGMLALGMLERWIEATISAIAKERGTPIMLGGIVRDDNPRHRRALERRGYTPLAVVLSKEFKP